MITKIKAEYTYSGLGFPILLKNVEMIYLDGGWWPKINVAQVALEASLNLASRTPEDLTEAERDFLEYYHHRRC